MIKQQNVPQEDSNSTLNSKNPNLQAVTVEVEKITERQRQITAKIEIPHPVEKVWQVLTDYQALSDFVPSLASSKKLEHPSGGIRLEQIGSQRLLKLNFSARVVLDLEESFPDLISFQMVEGDFKDFSGSWRLNNCVLDDKTGTLLCYTVKVWPKLTMPIRIIEPRLSQDMQSNLLAVRERVEELTGKLLDN
ncbi:SRPBCC family protein [Calothrix sp. CCY 0018]|uniref:SRPBCC family protein n=1 Tax=Calothrix sp. CCY 0018 TaxID=3103864 RepID=UPI0039C71485